MRTAAHYLCLVSAFIVLPHPFCSWRKKPHSSETRCPSLIYMVYEELFFFNHFIVLDTSFTNISTLFVVIQIATVFCSTCYNQKVLIKIYYSLFKLYSHSVRAIFTSHLLSIINIYSKRMFKLFMHNCKNICLIEWLFVTYTAILF